MTRELSHPRRTAERRRPGDPDREELVKRMIRVDQAGEYGAKRIYAGQLAVLGRSLGAGVIRKMAEQEERHLAAFDQLIVERRVRPTALQPLWYVTGFALGAATALLGERAAMACTVAVEEVIDEHYARQATALGDDEAALRERIEEFRAARDRAQGDGACPWRRGGTRLSAFERRHQGGLAPRHLALDAHLIVEVSACATAGGAEASPPPPRSALRPEPPSRAVLSHLSTYERDNPSSRRKPGPISEQVRRLSFL